MVLDCEIEIILKTPQIIPKWAKKLGFVPQINTPIKVHWSLLKTTTFRRKNIKIKCDDCGVIYEKNIFSVKGDFDLCTKCMNKGERNGMFGSQPNENFLLSKKNMIIEKGNPFTWDSVKTKIKEKNVWVKIADKNRGSKRSELTKKKLSNSIKIAYKEGRLKPSNVWGKIKTDKYEHLTYQSSYELNFIKYCESKHILFFLENAPPIEYFDDDGGDHTYYPDFKIKNSDLIIEIKSSYTWEKNLRINEIKKEYAEKLYDYIIIMDNDFNEFNEKLKQKFNNILLD